MGGEKKSPSCKPQERSPLLFFGFNACQYARQRHMLRSPSTWQHIARSPRPRDVPFSAASPHGLMHGYLRTSTAPRRTCSIPSLAGKTLAQKLRTLDTVVNICVADSAERFARYGSAAAAHVDEVYQFRSDRAAYFNMVHIYKLFSKTLKKAVRRGVVTDPRDFHALQKTHKRIRDRLRAWSYIVAEPAVGPVPFSL